MAGLLLTMLAVLAVSLGARDQVLVARLAPRGAVLAVAVFCAVGTSIFAGWAGHAMAPLLSAPARAMLVAMALAVAALELLFIRPGRKAAEPTQSLGAFTVVVLAQQLFDAARLLIFAIAAASPFPAAVIVGGAFGSAASVLAGWLGEDSWERQPLAQIRRGLGVLLLLVAAWLAYNR